MVGAPERGARAIERSEMTQGSRLLVTGGCGFIGSNFARAWVADGRSVVDLDALTYAGDTRRVEDLSSDAYRRVTGDVADRDLVAELVRDLRPDLVVHFAAETHVTRSERDPEAFLHANVEGTRSLLDALSTIEPAMVIHVSTDEVYGPTDGAPFREDQKETGEGKATSAYAKSKAVGDDLARSYADRLPLIVVRPTNCFGPAQHPEKALARWLTRAVRGLRLPVWGDGEHIRDWLPVEDACAAIDLLLRAGTPGEVYNIGPSRTPEITNIELARWIVAALGQSEDRIVLTAYDRPDHDRRYAVDAGKLRALGWEPSPDVWERFAATLAWYRDNEPWWAPMIQEAEAIYEDRDELQDATP
jgi:dTDP-glucose 4,6-dehydratase